jgi:hypothetical protein
MKKGKINSGEIEQKSLYQNAYFLVINVKQGPSDQACVFTPIGFFPQ